MGRGAALQRAWRLGTAKPALYQPAPGLSLLGPFPSFQLAFDGLPNQLRTALSSLQDFVHTFQRSSRKSGWRLLIVDLSAPHSLINR